MKKTWLMIKSLVIATGIEKKKGQEGNSSY